MSYYKCEDPYEALRMHAVEARKEYMNSSPEELLDEMCFEGSEEGPEISVDLEEGISSFALEETVKAYCDPNPTCAEQMKIFHESMKNRFPPGSMVRYDVKYNPGGMLTFSNVRGKWNPPTSESVSYGTKPPSELHPFSTDVPLIGGMPGGRRRRKGGGRRRKRKGKIPQEKQYRRLENTNIPRGFMGNVPVRTQTRKRMVFYEPNLALVPGGVSFYVRDWRMNSVYDPDPAIGGGTVSGFSQFAAIWNIYRVDRMRFRYEVESMETTQPVQFYFTMKDYQPSTVLTTYALCQDAAEVSGATQPHVLGVLTGNNIYRSSNGRNPDNQWTPWINPASILGDPLLYRASAGYSGQGLANPTSVIWLSFVLMADGPGGTMPNGVVLNIEMEFQTMWFSTVSTLPSLTKLSKELTDLQLAKDHQKKLVLEMTSTEPMCVTSFSRSQRVRTSSVPPSIKRG